MPRKPSIPNEPPIQDSTMTDTVRTMLTQMNAVNTVRGQLALTLAATLEKGAGISTAAVSRELRSTLKDIELEYKASQEDETAAFLAKLAKAADDS